MDSGYSWLVLAGSFINHLILLGNIKSFGILYTEILATYNRSSGSTAFIDSIKKIIAALVGPIAGYVSVTYSFRIVVLIGGIFTVVGLSTSALTTCPELLFVTYSFVAGVGFGLAQAPTVSIINFYFDKQRALANGLFSSAGGFATFIFPSLYRYAFDVYGLHGGLLIIGAVSFNICVGASSYRQPLHRNIKRYNQKGSITCMGVILNYIHELFKTFKKILQNRVFIIYSLGFILAMFGYMNSFMLLPPHLRSRGVLKSAIAQMFMVMGAVEIPCRVIFGIILDRKYIKPETLFIFNTGFVGICSILFPFFNSVPIFYSYYAINGGFAGAVFFLSPLMIIQICGLQLLPQALSLVFLLKEIINLFGAPFIAYLEDLTGNWNTSFYILGSSQVLSAIIIFIGRRYGEKISQTVNKNRYDDNLKPESMPVLKNSDIGDES